MYKFVHLVAVHWANMHIRLYLNGKITKKKLIFFCNKGIAIIRRAKQASQEKRFFYLGYWTISCYWSSSLLALSTLCSPIQYKRVRGYRLLFYSYAYFIKPIYCVYTSCMFDSSRFKVWRVDENYCNKKNKVLLWILRE